MAKRNILIFGDETLRKVSKPVTDFNERLSVLLDDMKETMIDAQGVGLAAPQVGVLRRAVVIDTGEEIIDIINPEIISYEGEQYEYEGCLSYPGMRGWAACPQKVEVKAFDRHGNEYNISGEGLMARALWHEIEHLDGKLYIDRAEKMFTNEEVEEILQEQAAEEEARATKEIKEGEGQQ